MTLVRDIKEIAQHAGAGAARLEYRLVAEAGRSPQRPPLFVMGPAPEILLHDMAGALHTPKVGCYTLRDVVVAPTGFPVLDGAALHGEAFLHPRPLVVAISDRLNTESLPVRRVEGRLALLCGPAHETYGHWLVDFLPRLWVLRQAGYDPATLRYLVPSDLRPFAFAMMQACGIGPERIELYDHWREILHAEEFIMPAGLRDGDRFAPCFADAVAFWTNLVTWQDTPHAGRIFVARAGGTRRLGNRDAIEAMAAAQGFAIMRPETLDLSAQVALFRGARVILGEYGSALHNAIFSYPGAVVCALRGTARHPGFVQSGIATALDQHAAYVFGVTEGADAEQMFRVDEMQVQLGMEIAALAARPGAALSA